MDLRDYELKKTNEGYKFEKKAVDIWYIISFCIACTFLYLFLEYEVLRVIIYDFFK